MVVSSVIGIAGIYLKNLALTGMSYFCIACVQNLGYLVWVFFGSMIRFSDKGKACIGDGTAYANNPADEKLLVSSGFFMLVYLIMCYVMIGCACCAACAKSILQGNDPCSHFFN